MNQRAIDNLYYDAIAVLVQLGVVPQGAAAGPGRTNWYGSA